MENEHGSWAGKPVQECSRCGQKYCVCDECRRFYERHGGRTGKRLICPICRD